MNIFFTESFKKSYAKRIASQKNLTKKFEERYDLFELNPQNPQLRDHALIGRLHGYRSFSITGDVRVVYYVFKGDVYFVDVGSHNQVYGK